MTSPRQEVRKPGSSSRAVRRIGCVSYLNAKPLIEGLEGLDDPVVCFDVPSRLLEDLQRGAVDAALCPVIDYYRSEVPLEIVPVGGIGSEGPTLTVRLLSRSPIQEVTAVHADTDSHTSVALMRILLAERFNLRPQVIPFHAREHVAHHRLIDAPETMLLIGDKVVTDSPSQETYPHQLDLGEAWHALTGLPFVFAIWMTRAGTDLGDLPALLNRQRELNAGRIDAIVDRHAASHGWPRDLARQYLGSLLRYTIGAPQLRAIERFGELAHKHGLIDAVRPLKLRR